MQHAGVGDGAAGGGDQVEGLVWADGGAALEGAQGRLADQGGEVGDGGLDGAGGFGGGVARFGLGCFLGLGRFLGGCWRRGVERQRGECQRGRYGGYDAPESRVEAAEVVFWRRGGRPGRVFGLGQLSGPALVCLAGLPLQQVSDRRGLAISRCVCAGDGNYVAAGGAPCARDAALLSEVAGDGRLWQAAVGSRGRRGGRAGSSGQGLGRG